MNPRQLLELEIVQYGWTQDESGRYVDGSEWLAVVCEDITNELESSQEPSTASDELPELHQGDFDHTLATMFDLPCLDESRNRAVLAFNLCEVTIFDYHKMALGHFNRIGEYPSYYGELCNITTRNVWLWVNKILS